MTTAMAPQPTAVALERVLIGGDLSKLSEPERISYYNALCQSLGLNPLTQPFQYLTLSGKLVLYAKRDATEQLRKIHGVSIERLEKERTEDLYVVTAYARDSTGRMDVSTGAVPLGTLKGEPLANAIMKCETKAKRRVTLSICGLGMLDETEVESITSQREPLIVSSPAKELPEAPEGTVFVMTVESKPNGPFLYAKVVLSDGREVIAKDQGKDKALVGLLEQAAQAQWPMEIVTRRVKARGGKDYYDLIEEARRATTEPQAFPVAVPDVAPSDAVL